jgi:hypothetical protein
MSIRIQKANSLTKALKSMKKHIQVIFKFK